MVVGDYSCVEDGYTKGKKSMNRFWFWTVVSLFILFGIMFVGLAGGFFPALPFKQSPVNNLTLVSEPKSFPSFSFKNLNIVVSFV